MANHVTFERLKSLNGGDVIKGAIIDVNSIVYVWNKDILTSIITQLLTSRPFGDLSPLNHVTSNN